jgi:HEAT repeat protein
LIRSLKDVESEVRRQSVISLAHCRNRDFLPALRSALRDEDPGVRKVAVNADAQFGEALVFDDLISALSDPDWRVRQEAAIALGQFAGQASETALRDSLGDPSWQVVREAALSLSRLRVDGGEGLARLLTHDLADLRIAGAKALGESRNRSWFARIEPLLTDRDAGVRKAARLAIERLSAAPDSGTKEAIANTLISPSS